MSLATRTISINPAFLQEIKEDHHELRQLMHHTSAMLNRPRWMATELDRLTELCTKLRDQLAMHFSLEEAYGYFEDAVSVAPHLSRRAEQLRGEHYTLFSQFCQLTELAEALRYEGQDEATLGRLVDGYRDFAMRLYEHEANETELILAAFNEDLGAGD
jgi:hypothetical protein